MTDLELAKEKLISDDLTCVVLKDGKFYYSNERGIISIIGWLCDMPGILEGAVIADKVRGKAAALLFAFGGVKEVYAKVISVPAAEVFQKENIRFSFEKQVNHIENRTKTGFCPMEMKAMDISSPKLAFEVFRDVVNKGN